MPKKVKTHTLNKSKKSKQASIKSISMIENERPISVNQSKRSKKKKQRVKKAKLSKIIDFSLKNRCSYQKQIEMLMDRISKNSSIKLYYDSVLKLRKKIDDFEVPEGLYYMTDMLNAVLERKKVKKAKMFQEHFMQLCHSYLYLRKIKKPSMKDLEPLMVKDLPNLKGGK